MGDPLESGARRALELVFAVALAGAGSWVASYFTMSERVTRAEERLQAVQVQLAALDIEVRRLNDRLDVVRVMVLQHAASSPLPSEKGVVR